MQGSSTALRPLRMPILSVAQMQAFDCAALRTVRTPLLASPIWRYSPICRYRLARSELNADSLEPVCLVVSRHSAVGYVDDRETLRRSHARSLPPVAADGSAGDVGDSLVLHVLVDMGMAL